MKKILVAEDNPASRFARQDVAQAETQLTTTRAQATDLGIQRAGGILSTAQALFVERDLNGDGIPDSPDSDPVVCVGLICFPAGFQNTPVRTFWTQRSLD